MWRADLNTTGIKSEGMIWRDEERRRARGLERARGVWRQFIMRLGIDIIKVAVNLKQVVADLIIERRIPTPAFLCREVARTGVKVKPREYIARTPDTVRAVEIAAGRGQSVTTVRRSRIFSGAG